MMAPGLNNSHSQLAQHVSQHQSHDDAVRWDRLYSKRRRIAHASEDTPRLNYIPSQNWSLIDKFLEVDKSQNLDPPDEFSYSILRHFVDGFDTSVLDPSSAITISQTAQVLLDEREDNETTGDSTRQWQSPSEDDGYLFTPPMGLVKNSATVNLKTLRAQLGDKVVNFRFVHVKNNPDCSLENSSR
jgi:hypothetical protein